MLVYKLFANNMEHEKQALEIDLPTNSYFVAKCIAIKTC